MLIKVLKQENSYSAKKLNFQTNPWHLAFRKLQCWNVCFVVIKISSTITWLF